MLVFFPFNGATFSRCFTNRHFSYDFSVDSFVCVHVVAPTSPKIDSNVFFAPFFTFYVLFRLFTLFAIISFSFSKEVFGAL